MKNICPVTVSLFSQRVQLYISVGLKFVYYRETIFTSTINFLSLTV